MKQGMLIKNENNQFCLEDSVLLGEGEHIELFEEEEQVWLTGTVHKDTFGEIYFTDGFLVSYLYEGLPVRML